MSISVRKVERRILRHLHGCKSLAHLPQIHGHFLRHGLHQINQILSHFVSVCGSLDNMLYADRIFRQAEYPNILLFNSMIKGFSLRGPFEQSLHFFSLMKNRGIWADQFTFAPLLKACSNVRDVRLGQCIHADVVRVGFECHGSIRIGIVELYTNCGKMEDAKKVFDEMPERDVIVWNLMIQGFCQKGDVEMGISLFRQMRERSVVSWNSMLSCLAKSGRDSEALGIFHEMWYQGFEPDEATVVTVLPVCARLGAFDIGQRIHSYIEANGRYRPIIQIGNALLDFYCKCGFLEAALQVFSDMPNKNVISWNAMILGLAFNGKGDLGVNVFEEMMNIGVSPNDATFVGVLSCCVHAGLVKKGRELFNSMIENHHIEPKLEHYGCVVDLLGRSGCVQEAHDLIRSMPMMPNAALWGALLSSCRTYGDTKLAEVSIKELINLEAWNSGNYVLLSNIYAEEGRWDEVESLRGLMRDENVMKEPGHSSIG